MSAYDDRIGTYNQPYKGEIHTPEGLFQSIPEPVPAEQVIYAAHGIVERLRGITGLFTTNGRALNDHDMELALFGLEAMIDQLGVVLRHRTTDGKKPSAGHGAPARPEDMEAIKRANTVALKKVAAMKTYLEHNDGGDIAVLGADLEQLHGFIDAINAVANQIWQRSKYHAELNEPEEYMVSGLPVFGGFPYDLYTTMTARARSAVEALTHTVQGAAKPLEWQVTHTLLWDVRSQLEMAEKVLQRVATEDKP